MRVKEDFEALWFVVYIFANIFTLGTFWFFRGLISHAIRKAIENR